MDGNTVIRGFGKIIDGIFIYDCLRLTTIFIFLAATEKKKKNAAREKGFH
jgi:hypothetical protein